MDAVRLADRVAFRPERMHKAGLFDTPRMFLDLYCLEPDQEQRVHAHAGADKVYVLLEGEGTFHVAGEERRLDAGHAVLAPADAPHGVRNAGPGRLTLLVFMAPNPNQPQ